MKNFKRMIFGDRHYETYFDFKLFNILFSITRNANIDLQLNPNMGKYFISMYKILNNDHKKIMGFYFL